MGVAAIQVPEQWPTLPWRPPPFGTRASDPAPRGHRVRRLDRSTTHRRRNEDDDGCGRPDCLGELLQCLPIIVAHDTSLVS